MKEESKRDSRTSVILAQHKQRTLLIHSAVLQLGEQLCTQDKLVGRAFVLCLLRRRGSRLQDEGRRPPAMAEDFVMEEEGEEDAAEREARDSAEWRAEEGDEGSGGVLPLSVATLMRIQGCMISSHWYK